MTGSSSGSSVRVRHFIGRYRAALSSLGAIASILLGIYSDQARASITWTWHHAPAFLLWALVAATASTASWHARGRFDRRHTAPRPIIAKALEIRAADFDDDLPHDQAVFGRELHFLERATDSDTLVVLLHGVGLDADDFRPYMNIAHEHTAAITLFGFNQSESHDPRYRPIGLTTHAELVNGAINHICRENPDKKLILVGFSIGADMIMRLGELWRQHPERSVKIGGLLLLDPNINHSSMLLTGGFAAMNPQQPLAEFKRIAQIPGTMIEFQNITEYLHKISKKNPAQIQHHAEDWWNYWEPDGHYDAFLNRLDGLRNACPTLKVFFSVHYEEHFNEVVARSRSRGLNRNFELLRVDHFDLITEEFLARQIADL